MLTEVARITAIGDSCLWVETQRKAQCHRCSANKACGHSLLNKIHHNRINQIKVMAEDPSPLEHLNVGDSVLIGIEDKMILRISLMFYLLPLTGLLIFALFAFLLSVSEGIAIISGLTGLGLGFFLLKWQVLHGDLNFSLQAVLVSDNLGQSSVQLVHGAIHRG